MDKNKFISVLHHFSGSSVAEAEEILSLKKLYPYSQVLHVLSAKVSRDHGFSNQQQELQLAAIYASDRSVLKEVMNAEYNRDVVINVGPEIKPAKKKSVENFTKTSSVTVLDPQILKTIDSVDLADAVLQDLQRLNKSKHDFEAMFDGISAHPTDVETVRSKAEEAVLKTHQKIEEIAAKQEKSGKSKKERIIELARALEAERSSPEPENISEEKKTGESLIDEIASTKNAINPETEKQKKQIEIIDQFIKAQPTIVNSKDKPMPVISGDFSTIKSGEFGDNIVSETLVDILIKQGKKDKAVEVLKKLIWKYPQKKAYFAAQIDDLKK